jgi:predicted nucleotidyltransferase
VVANIIERKKDVIAALCRKHQVRALWVFGSAATGSFDPVASDVDFLVDLGYYDALVHRRFFDLHEALEALFDRSVDLLTVRSIENPFLMDELEETRKLVHGSPDAEVAA